MSGCVALIRRRGVTLKIKDKFYGDEFQKYVRLHGAAMIIHKLCDRIFCQDDGKRFTQEQLVALLTIGRNLLGPDNHPM